MQYTNRHLVEVNCGFQFPNETTTWDSTFFGQYYEKIKSLGFIERQERKGVQIRFNPNPQSASGVPLTSSEVEDQVIFKNNNRGMAIAMGKNKISFHIIKDYSNWQDFVNNLIEPYSRLYKDLGLGNGIRHCNVIYLNRFVKPINVKLSDYFTIVSPTNSNFGVETSTIIQRVISNESNHLITKLNSQATQNMLNINLECGAICSSLICMNREDWIFQANQTHEPIKEFFETLITENQRKELQ